MATDSSPAAKPARRYDLDWLRVIAVLLLVPFHSALMFALSPQHVVYIKARVGSDLLLDLAGLLHLWHMPLLFLIAGAATYFALGKRSGGQYLQERGLRLGIPIVFAMLTLLPLMVNIRTIGKPAALPVVDAFVRFWTIDPRDLTGLSGHWTPAHLWFILYLLIFSVAALPLFLALRHESARRVTGALAALLALPGMILVLPAIGVGLLDLLPSLGDKNPFYFLGWFVLGYLFMTDARYQATLRRWTWLALILAIGATLACNASEWFGVRISGLSYGSLAWGLVYQLARWNWVITILGLGSRTLTANNRLLRYCGEAAYPFYILHLPVNTIVGALILPLQASIGVRYALITVITVALTLLVYEVAVRRWAVMRFLFGMKPRPRTVHVPVQAVGAEPA